MAKKEYVYHNGKIIEIEDKKKSHAGVRALAVLLALAVLAGGVCACGFSSRNDDGAWFKNSDIATWHWTDTKPQEDGGDNGSENGLGASNYVLCATDTQLMGLNVDPIATYSDDTLSEDVYNENTYMLTVRTTPSVGITVKWTAEFLNSESEWATDKVTSDYVVVSEVSTDTLSATITCKQAFGEPIVIKAASTANPSCYATCQVDYRQKYIGTIARLSQNRNANPRVNFFTRQDGGTTFATFPNNIKVDNNKCAWQFYEKVYEISVGDTYTLPFEATCTVSCSIRVTDGFKEQINMYNKMIGGALIYAEGWVDYDSSNLSSETNLNTNGALQFNMNNKEASIAAFLNCLFYNITVPVVTTDTIFDDSYANLYQCFQAVAANHEYCDAVFEIKVCTNLTYPDNTEKRYEAVTGICPTVRDFEASDITMDKPNVEF